MKTLKPFTIEYDHCYKYWFAIEPPNEKCIFNNALIALNSEKECWEFLLREGYIDKLPEQYNESNKTSSKI